MDPEKVAISDQITAVVLAGGKARRMGGQDKGLITVARRAMISYVINALSPQVSTLLINANRNSDRYREFGYEVIADSIAGYWGPLSGMASALQSISTPLLVTTPCDSPFVPDDLVARLSGAMNEAGAEISVAHDGERMQPVFSLLRADLSESLDEYLQSGERKIDRWFKSHHCVTADFSDRPETFMNINTPEDVAMAEAKLSANPK
jgi:molybdopterin-guanine dinucleotide biosynthesis protein A